MTVGSEFVFLLTWSRKKNKSKFRRIWTRLVFSMIWSGLSFFFSRLDLELNQVKSVFNSIISNAGWFSFINHPPLYATHCFIFLYVFFVNWILWFLKIAFVRKRRFNWDFFLFRFFSFNIRAVNKTFACITLNKR